MMIKKLIKYFIFNVKAICSYLFYNSKFEIDKKESVLITHSLGGGTEQYVQQGKFSDYVIVRKIGFGKDYFFEILWKGKRKIITRKKIFFELKDFKIFFVNSLVSYSMKEEIISFLIKEKKRKNVKLQYVLHDFDCLCRDNVNLILDNSFCKLNCSGCRKNDKKYVSIWEAFLLQCDTIRCFSVSSKELLFQKYGKISEKRVVVVPHDIQYCKAFSPIKKNNEDIHIGFIGNCNSIPKGKNVVVPFLKFCKKKNIKVSVVGKFNFKNMVFGKTIRYLGRYNNYELGKILEREGINVVFFTSICPETFSYLVSELMACEVFLCCFDMGAQAEKIKAYKYGHLIEQGDSQDMFNQINSFWKPMQ